MRVGPSTPIVPAALALDRRRGRRRARTRPAAPRRSRCRWPRAGRGRGRRAAGSRRRSAARGCRAPRGPSRRRRTPGHAGGAAHEDVLGVVARALGQGGQRPGRPASSVAASPVGGTAGHAPPAARPDRWAVRWAVAAADPLLADVSAAARACASRPMPSRQHDDQQRGRGAERRRAGPSARSPRPGRRADHDAGEVGEVRQQAAGLGQHLLELAVGPGEEVAHLLRPSGPAGGPGSAQVVDEEAVALLGGHPAGARVGLAQVALGLERRPSRCARSPTTRRRPGPWRRGPSPTGCAVSMYSSTTARRMAALRSSSMVTVVTGGRATARCRGDPQVAVECTEC